MSRAPLPARLLIGISLPVSGGAHGSEVVDAAGHDHGQGTRTGLAAQARPPVRTDRVR